ncbi:MAG TPA: hypothetical protein VM099_01250 [Gemmatimonadaceae bacterium]|nr:hypothetical protein [Gemmatimonadaceae bacterium]
MKPPREKDSIEPQTADDDVMGDISRLHAREIRDILLAPAPNIVENVFFTKVGHSFGPEPSPTPGMPQQYVVQDFLLDQTGASGSDGKMSNLKYLDLTTTTTYRFNVYPRDRSKRIKVMPPALARAYFGFNGGRKFVNAVSDVSDAFPANSFFSSFAGNAPTFNSNTFFIGRNTNHWVQFVVDAEVRAFDFFGFTTIGSYPSRSFDPGTKSYLPYSTALPFNLPGANGVPFLVFSYLTERTRDPGPFVFMV